MGQFDFLIKMMTVQIFWSIALTLLISATPTSEANYLTLAQYQDGTFDLLEAKAQFEGVITNQTNIPFVNAGALIFYSGNLILDIMVNFFTFVPQMFCILITIITQVFPVDPTLINNLKLFITVFLGIMYVIGLLAFISQYRNPGGI